MLLNGLVATGPEGEYGIVAHHIVFSAWNDLHYQAANP